jgi:FlaA1/EpsC-like NDP-sugar epimerase
VAAAAEWHLIPPSTNRAQPRYPYFARTAIEPGESEYSHGRSAGSTPDAQGDARASRNIMKIQTFRNRLAHGLVNLSSKAKVLMVCLTDAILLIFAAAVAVRLSGPAESGWSEVLRDPFLLAAPAATVLVLLLLGAYRYVVRFLGSDELLRLIGGVATGGIAVIGAQMVFGFQWVVPVTALFYVAFSATLLVAVRGVASLFLRPARHRLRKSDPVVIYGAGEGGAQLAAAMAVSGRYRVVAFVDDRKELHGRRMLGIRIHPPAHLKRLKEEGRVERILLAVPSLDRPRRRKLLEQLAPLAIKVLAIPDLTELADGQQRIDDLRPIEVEDLLSREAIAPLSDLLARQLGGRSVLVTGAGGSIGSELCRQIVAGGARKLVLLEITEYALYAIHQDLLHAAARAGCELVPVLGNVLDDRRLQSVLIQHEVQTIYHAAAYKHVPLVEQNIAAAVHNNVFGTLSVAQAAVANGVESLVLVSTDKAVRPTSVMGASKRVCELTVQALAEQHPQVRMSMVRFGNVLGSSGSVVPRFIEQIRKGGPVTVTHPDVTRFFMTISEAALLVIQAGAMGQGGEVFVLDMGESVRIAELAEKIINLHGLEVKSDVNPHGDIAIEYTGLRPGEKLYEELLIGADARTTRHPRILQAQEQFVLWGMLRPALERMRAACEWADDHALLRELRRLVPGFRSAVPEAGGAVVPASAVWDSGEYDLAAMRAEQVLVTADSA